MDFVSSARGGTSPYLGTLCLFEGWPGRSGTQLCQRVGALGRRDKNNRRSRSLGAGALHFAPVDLKHDQGRRILDGPTSDISEVALKGLAHIAPRDPDPEGVATAIAKVVEMPLEDSVSLRIDFAPFDDGAAVVDDVADRARADLLRRIGLADLLKPVVIS